MGCGICKPDPKVLDKEVIPNELLDSSEHYIGPIDAKEIEDDEAVVEA